MSPSAVNAAIWISIELLSNRPTKSEAYFSPSSFASAEMAAHAGKRSSAGKRLWIPAARSGAWLLSSRVSSNSFAISRAWSFAFPPMLPRAKAAAPLHNTSGLFLRTRTAEGTRADASSCMLKNTDTALFLTIAQLSPSRAPMDSACSATRSLCSAKKSTAAIFTSLCGAPNFAPTSEAYDFPLLVYDNPVMALLTTLGTSSPKHLHSSCTYSSAPMLPRAKHAAARTFALPSCNEETTLFAR
mmetsp:Transcript_44272/g.117380  ORF Transcript_44272/g.117380 Transcript_44272/m.117380 type:complete len:243 (+) Transcript_44272:637-1365(+)